jgi:hypothetical protein
LGRRREKGDSLRYPEIDAKRGEKGCDSEGCRDDGEGEGKVSMRCRVEDGKWNSLFLRSCLCAKGPRNQEMDHRPTP